MNRLTIQFVVLSIALLAGFSSCKSKKGLQTVQQPSDTTDRCRLDYKNGKTLERLMKEKEMQFTTASGRFNCELTMNEETNTINVSVRCRKDSVIWLNMSKMGIDVLRALITKDSVKFMVMTDAGSMTKSYFKGDYTYVNQQLKADLDYDVIQALLFGNSAEFVSDSVKLKPGRDRTNCQYLLSTIRKRRLHKMIEGAQQPKESVQVIWLDPVLWKIVMLEYSDPDTKRKFNACYGDFQPVDNYSMPFSLFYTVLAEKIIKADITWTRIKLNDGVSFPYRVPDSYEPIEFKKKEENQQGGSNQNNGSGNQGSGGSE